MTSFSKRLHFRQGCKGGRGSNFKTPSDIFLRMHLHIMPTDENLRILWSCSSILFVLVRDLWDKYSFSQKLQVLELFCKRSGLFLNKFQHVPHRIQGDRALLCFLIGLTVSIEAKPNSELRFFPVSWALTSLRRLPFQ